jgi:hypothetical protein
VQPSAEGVSTAHQQAEGARDECRTHVGHAHEACAHSCTSAEEQHPTVVKPAEDCDACNSDIEEDDQWMPGSVRDIVVGALPDSSWERCMLSCNILGAGSASTPF